MGEEKHVRRKVRIGHLGEIIDIHYRMGKAEIENH
jgi:hypothetical protein